MVGVILLAGVAGVVAAVAASGFRISIGTAATCAEAALMTESSQEQWTLAQSASPSST